MPTYEYVCTDCKNEWEEIQKISEDALKVCPKCGKDTAKRQISGGNFILKGGGWYADLYSSTPKKAEKTEGGGDKAEAKSEGKSEGAGKDAKPSDGKSEAKPEKKPSAAPPAKADTSSSSGSSSSGTSTKSTTPKS